MTYTTPDSDVLYLTTLTTSGIVGYEDLQRPPMTAAAEVELTQAVSASDGEVLVHAFVSPALGVTDIAGDWTFNIYGAVDAMDGVSELVGRVYRRTLAGVETELFDITTGEIEAVTATLYTDTAATASTDITVDITDRIVLKMYAKTDYATPITVSLFYLGEVNQSRMTLPVQIAKITGGDMLTALYDSDLDGLTSSAAPSNPLTALGDMIFASDSDGTQDNLAIGSAGQYLMSTSDGIPGWAAVAAGGHVIQDGGTPVTQRANLNFIGATITDDAGNDATKITAPVIYTDQSGGTADTYGELGGLINGANTTYTVSQAVYKSGMLRVYRNGQLLTQGTTTSGDWTELDPATGTFTITVAPSGTDQLTAIYGSMYGVNPALTNPMANYGDMIFSADSDGTPDNIAIGTSGQYLMSSSDGRPEWSTVSIPSSVPPALNIYTNTTFI